MSEVSCIVVDDFASNAAARRARALKLEFRDLNQTGIYTDYQGTSQDDQRISQTVGRKLVSANPSGNGRFCARFLGQSVWIDVHVDACAWGAILYLGARDREGGTNLYRHRETGLMHWPSPAERKALGLPADHASVWKQLVLEDGKDQSKWEVEIHVPARFNRLTLVQGGVFHGIAPVYGHDVSTGRLSQVYFYNEVSGASRKRPAKKAAAKKARRR